MEMHRLRYFVAVAQTGSFSRAADLCHVSQPSLSQQIAKLERNLGRKLFNRLNRTVTLTDAGRVLLEQATMILSAVEDTEKRLRDNDDLRDARLTVGAIPTIAPYLLPRVLEQFLAECPGVEMTVQEDVTEQMIAALVDGTVDVALVALPIDDERIKIRTLFSEPLFLALPPQHKLTRKRRLKIEHLQDERFIVLNEMHCLGEQVLSFCRINNYSSRIGCRSAQIATIQELIASGQGISILPEMAVRHAQNGGRRSTPAPVYRALSDATPIRTVAVAWHRHRYLSLAARRFIDSLSTLER